MPIVGGKPKWTGAPAAERPEVLDAVAEFARAQPGVRAAYRALVLVVERERPTEITRWMLEESEPFYRS